MHISPASGLQQYLPPHRSVEQQFLLLFLSIYIFFVSQQLFNTQSVFSGQQVEPHKDLGQSVHFFVS